MHVVVCDPARSDLLRTKMSVAMRCGFSACERATKCKLVDGQTEYRCI